MKNKYIFILGRTPELSIAEIQAVFKRFGWEFTSILNSSEVYILESEQINTSVLNKTLGGTVKIGVVVSEISKDKLEEIITADFLIEKVFAKNEGKVQFGISVYDGGNKKSTEELSYQINDISKGIKALLDEKDISSRFSFNKERALSSVSVDKNKLIQKGAEILLITAQENVYIGKTVCVQEYEAFSTRDYGRPVRDMRSGVMPPKLARMMINLSGADIEDVILDPFCGSGTVLQEAILLGFKHIIGRDISEKAVHDTEENLSWLKEKVSVKYKLDVKKGDVKKISYDLQLNSISAIVTEPYLGPTLHGEIFPEKLKSIRTELRSLYLEAFSEFNKILKSGGVIVMIFPTFTQKGFLNHMEILDSIKSLGFVQVKMSDTFRGSILVGNKYDFVVREIVVFQKA